MKEHLITDEEMTSLLVAIKNRYGLDFTNYEKTSFKRGILRLMMKHKMESLLDLWGTILHDNEFFHLAIDDLLVNLTELFRNPDVWLKLRNEIIPTFNLIRPLSIWHAGCSTGEEVYTSAIVLEETGYLRKNMTIATDLSTKALNKARKGSYPNQIIQAYLKPFLTYFPTKALSDFFDFDEKNATIKAHYKPHIEFKKHNLVHDGVIGKFDIIFCRNVMIYFDDLLKSKVLDLLYESMHEQGYLIIGYYDIMPEYGKKLFDLVDIQTRVYTKKKVRL